MTTTTDSFSTTNTASQKYTIVTACTNSDSTTRRFVTIVDVPRQPLSIILSYLTEKDGTALLLCRPCWTQRVLPLFKIRPSSQFDNLTVTNHPDIRHRNRYQFRAIPIPDSATLLDRLNTRRLYNRKRNERRRNGGRNSRRRSEADELRDSVTTHEEGITQLSLTTQEIAFREWKQTVVLVSDSAQDPPDARKQLKQEEEKHQLEEERIYPSQPPLASQQPLLQFYNSKIHDNVINGNHPSMQQPHQQPQQQQQVNQTDPIIPLFYPVGTTVLASYPRSGNTFLRTLLERVTGFVTGSDTRPDRPLSMALRDQFDLVGEGLVDGRNVDHLHSHYHIHYPELRENPSIPTGCGCCCCTTSSPSTPIVKTHWPERIGWQPYKCRRLILLVRNPWDAIDSYWHLNATNTHTEKVVDDVYRDHYELWYNLVRNEFQIWNDFLSFYQTQSKYHVPVLWVRYEDLVLNQYEQLERILRFCTPTDWWRDRLDLLISKSNNGGNENDDGGDGDGDDSDNRGSNTTVRSSVGSSSSSKLPRQQQRQQQQHLYGSNQRSSSSPSSSTAAMQSIGRTIRRGRYPKELLKELHDMYSNSSHEVDPDPPTTNYTPHLTTSSSNDNSSNLTTTATTSTQMKSNPEPKTNWLKVLGYDVLEQNFPNNLHALPQLPGDSGAPTKAKVRKARMTNNNNNSFSKMKINEPKSIEMRSSNSPYGRKMRDWRRKHTDDDRSPFPTDGGR